MIAVGKHCRYKQLSVAVQLSSCRGPLKAPQASQVRGSSIGEAGGAPLRGARQKLHPGHHRLRSKRFLRAV
jgi:hypothetical protein